MYPLAPNDVGWKVPNLSLKKNKVGVPGTIITPCH